MTHPNDSSEGPNPSGLCMCGCGGITPVSRKNETRWGHVKGTHRRYINGHNRRPDISRRYTVDPGTGCHLWTGKTEGGYAKWRVAGESRLVHRALYERRHGKLPPGVELHHVCLNRRCINPDHLRPTPKPVHLRIHNPLHPLRARVQDFPDDWSAPRIAAALGISATTVRDARRRATRCPASNHLPNSS